MFKIILNEQTPKAQKEVVFEEDERLVGDFYVYAKGQKCVGLASNQLSFDGKRLKKRFFVMFSGGKNRICINPVVLERKGHNVTRKEGCLTFPGKTIVATRNSKIRVKYQNESNSLVEEVLIGYDAQVFQHEFDHLEGVAEEFGFKEKVKNNEPCPCGSGKKYKKCCKI